ncbi:MAG: PEP-CTERM sorting domain-containing protein [Vicinamibacteria bacterium]
MPRLVFSTDLSDETADLKIVARMTNLVGQSNLLPTFTVANFAITPEPSSLLLMMEAGILWVGGYTLRRRRARG